MTRWGDIWFSTEESFYSRELGWVSDGDLLSTRGYVIRRNLDLLHNCNPAEEIANFGLDALEMRYRVWDTPYIAEYFDSGCLPDSSMMQEELRDPDQYPFCDEEVFDFDIGNSELGIIHKNATYNCCPDEIAVELEVVGNVLHFTEREVLTAPCLCLCCFDVTTKVADLAPGTYTVEYCFFDYERHAEICYIAEIVIP